MFKHILIALSIVMALAGHAVAKDKDEWQALAAREGCDVPVTMYDQPEQLFNAAFAIDWSGTQGSLHFLNFDRIPESWQLFIFYHEVGHCLQWKSGRMAQLEADANVAALEWDADEYAIEQVGRYRIDGAEVAAELLAEVYRRMGNIPDISHGGLSDRLQNGRLKRTFPRVES